MSNSTTNNLKIILHDGSEMKINAFSLPIHIIIECANQEELQEKWNKLTADNLITLSVLCNDELAFSFAHGNLDCVQSILNGDGTITAHFYFRGDNVGIGNSEYVTAAKILLGEEQ